MAYKIEIDKKAERDFKSLDNSVRIKIHKYLKKLANIDNPRIYGKALENNLSGYWRYRIVDGRVRYFAFTQNI